ncbi:unnamed protein product [Cylicocyclus nassatus]|uniref:Uncharacterized protein n=1 Tax=Cylicocyclus nassatus TaxID=53992 RepID=A0AA36HC49_CYLNA|nr:unnamed protein product [Cylicocyclus nassatus]
MRMTKTEYGYREQISVVQTSASKTLDKGACVALLSKEVWAFKMKAPLYMAVAGSIREKNITLVVRCDRRCLISSHTYSPESSTQQVLGLERLPNWQGKGKGMLPVPVPIGPQSRTNFVKHAPDVPVDIPAIVDPCEFHLRRKTSMTENLWKDCNEFYVNIWPVLVRRTPAFQSAKIKSAWCGLQDVNTFDSAPVIGELPFYQNLFMMCRFSGSCDCPNDSLRESRCQGTARNLKRSNIKTESLDNIMTVQRNGPSILTVKLQQLALQWMHPAPGIGLDPGMPSNLAREDSLMKAVKENIAKGDAYELAKLHVRRHMVVHGLNARKDTEEIENRLLQEELAKMNIF